MDLRMKMVTNLVGKDVVEMVGNYDRCLEMIQKKKMLLVVDDITKTKQFYGLIPNLKHLALESQVIITSRESGIVSNIMAYVPHQECAIYHMSGLSLPNSIEFFISHAFQMKDLDEVDVIFHDNVKEITKACCGLPLALEVIGGFLADRKDQPESWVKALSRLREDKDIITRLQISYDGLANEDEKDMFLDIACIMLGHSKRKALEVWDSLGYNMPNSSLSVLIAKCLVKVDMDGQLHIHDLLRDMGCRVVLDRTRGRKVEMQSHIWDPSIAAKILQNGHVLQWRDYHHKELPETLNLKILVVLDLANSVHLTHIWARDIETEFSMEELRMLILSNCTKLEELPQHINKLKFLDLDGCSSLNSLPDNLGYLTELEHLNLSGCINLTSLPNLSCSGSLRKLNLLNCKSLTKLPDSFSKLSGLEELGLSGCTLLQNLPNSICGLKTLAVLRMKKMPLKKLPDDFGQLCSFKVADFTDCKSLVELPESFGDLSNLQELWLTGCELQQLPTSFCRLTKITTLSLSGTCLEDLSDDFGQICSLKVADFTDCKSLVELPESFADLSNLDAAERGQDARV